MFKSRLPLLLAGALLVATIAPRVAFAQQRDAQARGMIRQAMEDYQNLDVDGALGRLRLALNGCGTNRCSPAMLARIHIAIGIVAVGGQNDAGTGTNEFAEALRLDPTAEPDAMLVTPEITAAFNQARQRAGVGGGSSGGGGREPGGRPGGGTSGGGGSSGPTTTLAHTAFPEQLENTPLPVFVESGNVRASSWVVHFRGLGMSRYETVNMESVANGYGAQIPCGQVIAPHVEYYITAQNDAGNVVATAGTAESPSRVNVVRARTQPPPALPGRMPPEQCGEDCPPGMTGPQCRGSGGGGGGGGSSEGTSRGMRQLGDPCESNNQCAEGMHCEQGSCASGEVAAPGPQSPFYRVAIDIGGGFGSAYISGTPNYAEYRIWLPDDPDWGMQPTCGPPREGADPMNPAAAGTLACPGRISSQPLSGGFAQMGFLYFSVRVNIINRIGLGVSVRFQPDSAGIGPLHNLFIGGRAYFAFTPGGFVRNGFSAAAFLGSGVGQIQVRPAINGNTPGAHVISGLNNVHLGLRAEYGLANLLHFGIEATGQFQIPNQLFCFDLQAMAGLHF